MASPERQITSSANFGEKLCSLFIDEISAAISERGACRLALTGGSIGKLLYPALLKHEQSHRRSLDWSRVEVFWGDERAVSRGDPLSNFKQANDLWLERSSIPTPNIHPMDPVPGELEARAREYESLMSKHGDASTPELDLVLLGFGPDGHVCSLFPGHPLLKESKRRVAAVTDSPKPPSERLTLTLPALLGARVVMLAGSGEGKAEAIAQSQFAECMTPLAQVLRGARRSILMLDRSAASQLEP